MAVPSSAKRKLRSSALKSSQNNNGKRNPSRISNQLITSRSNVNGSLAYGSNDAILQEREIERREKELERRRRKKERRLDELERGQATTAGWNENSTAHIPALSTSAAAIAGLLAGKRAERMENSNFDDLSSLETGSPSTNSNAPGTKKKQSSELKRLLTHKRGLKALLEDANSSATFKDASINFITSSKINTKYPSHRATAPLCTICGYWGDVGCMRCGDRMCGIKCTNIHDETRCERPL